MNEYRITMKSGVQMSVYGETWIEAVLGTDIDIEKIANVELVGER